MIRVKMTTPKGQLQEMAVAAIRDIRKRAVRILSRAGEIAVNTARDEALKSGTDWTDRTGNLRSSIGYIICEDGAPIMESNFERIDGPSRGEADEDGSETGRQYARQIATETRGLALVVVAGMNYAVYVADRGYDVLSSSQIVAKNLIPELFEKQAKYDEKNRQGD